MDLQRLHATSAHCLFFLLGSNGSLNGPLSHLYFSPCSLPNSNGSLSTMYSSAFSSPDRNASPSSTRSSVIFRRASPRNAFLLSQASRNQSNVLLPIFPPIGFQISAFKKSSTLYFSLLFLFIGSLIPPPISHCIRDWLSAKLFGPQIPTVISFSSVLSFHFPGDVISKHLIRPPSSTHDCHLPHAIIFSPLFLGLIFLLCQASLLFLSVIDIQELILELSILVPSWNFFAILSNSLRSQNFSIRCSTAFGLPLPIFLYIPSTYTSKTIICPGKLFAILRSLLVSTVLSLSKSSSRRPGLLFLAMQWVFHMLPIWSSNPR